MKNQSLPRPNLSLGYNSNHNDLVTDSERIINRHTKEHSRRGLSISVEPDGC
jgi:hypothetical protein